MCNRWWSSQYRPKKVFHNLISKNKYANTYEDDKRKYNTRRLYNKFSPAWINIYQYVQQKRW